MSGLRFLGASIAATTIGTILAAILLPSIVSPSLFVGPDYWYIYYNKYDNDTGRTFYFIDKNSTPKDNELIKVEIRGQNEDYDFDRHMVWYAEVNCSDSELRYYQDPERFIDGEAFSYEFNDEFYVFHTPKGKTEKNILAFSCGEYRSYFQRIGDLNVESLKSFIREKDNSDS